MVGGSRAAVALALGGWLMGSAAWAAEKTVVVLGTATPGGGFPVYGAAVADIINETDPTLAVQTRNTKGSTENVPLLEAGQLDLARSEEHTSELQSHSDLVCRLLLEKKK